MELVFVALPVALLVGGAALVAFVWAARTDQFEDLDSPPERILFEDDAARSSGTVARESASEGPSATPRGPLTRDAAGLRDESLDRT